MARQATMFWQKILICYWLVIPIAFFCYSMLTATKLNNSWSDLIIHLPGFSVGLLLSCLMLVQVIVFLQTKAELKEKFLLLSVFQQILTLNFVGAILSFVALKKYQPVESLITKYEKYTFYLYWSLIYLLSIFITFLFWRMYQ